MGVLYHGSSVRGMKELVPHQSTHGKYVYATKDKELTVIFSKRAGDDMTYSLFRTDKNEPWQLVERIPNGFETMFSNSASIYTVEDTTFQDIHTGFSELVSDQPVRILNEERVENVYEKIKELEQDGLIQLHYYPDRPEKIPEDDSDLINVELRMAQIRNRKIRKENFERLLFFHPNLLDRVNSLLTQEIENYIPYKKEDLVTIYEKYVLLQMIYPEREYFLSSSLIAITKEYPDLVPLLQDKLKMLDWTSEEKLNCLIDRVSKSIKNIPNDVLEQTKERYFHDPRSFPEKGEEILEGYKKISMMENLVNQPIDDKILENSILLIGPMGSGKTTMGNLLSEKLNMQQISLDHREQLAQLYKKSGHFKNFKEFEFFLTSTVLTHLQEPSVVDFGAGHSIYEDPFMFLEMKHLIEQFSHVILLMPSEEKEESLSILNEQKGIEEGSQRAKDNTHFVYSSCNEKLATLIQYTKGKNPSEITDELLMKLEEKTKTSTI